MRGTAPPPPPTAAALLRFWAWLGCVSFGGPAAQIALMHHELVEQRRWISEDRFRHALGYCMLLPGPEAQQLATYLGWLLHGRAMGIAAGLLFILPAWGLMLALAWLYTAHGQQPLVQALLAGVKPVVVALVWHAAWRLGRRTLDRPLWLGLAVAALALLGAGAPFALIVLGAGAAGWLLRKRLSQPDAPSGAAAGPNDALPFSAQAASSLGVLGFGLLLWALPMALLWGTQRDFLLQLGLFFTQAALLTFGGAYAVLPFVAQAMVQQFGWLSPAQLLDGLALGESTPGPLVLVLVFLAFVAGWPRGDAWLAALLAGYCTLLPSFILILAGAPWVERSRQVPALTVPLRAVQAAVVGVIAHLGWFLASHTLWPAGRPDAIGLAMALAALWALPRWGAGKVLALGALLGGLASLGA